MRKFAFLLLCIGMFVTLPVHAELFGLANGRSADITNAPERSIEGGVALGDFFDADYTHFGLRYNHKTRPQLMFFGNLGLSEVGSEDGLSFGIGAFYQLHGLLSNQDVAVKGVINRADGDNDDVTGISIEGLVSGRQGFGVNGNIGWYGNIGLHRFSGGGDSETEIGIGGGVTFPASNGEVFAGIDLIEDLIFGGGYRYYLQ